MKPFMIILLLMSFSLSLYAQDRCLECGRKCYENSIDGRSCTEEQQAIDFQEEPCRGEPSDERCGPENLSSYTRRNHEHNNEAWPLTNSALVVEAFKKIQAKQLNMPLPAQLSGHTAKEAILTCVCKDCFIEKLSIKKRLWIYENHSGSGFECGYHDLDIRLSAKDFSDLHLGSLAQGQEVGCSHDDADYDENTSLNQYVPYKKVYPFTKKYPGTWLERTEVNLNLTSDDTFAYTINGYFQHAGQTIWEEGQSTLRGELTVTNAKDNISLNLNMSCHTDIQD